MGSWRITGGTPTAEETAALTAVLTALLARRADVPGEPGEDERATTVWHRPHRNPHTPAGTWRTH
ncbi:acyl-CoA carboxylase subunit epsilon [Streptomyces collinus]|uniref:acyl-CoA carboxylase subunit epsilon n=1 Tax=Streptomyces collinus TaxID=42684 RepID=UPI003319CB1E